MEHWNDYLAHASQTVRQVFIYQLTLIVVWKKEKLEKFSVPLECHERLFLTHQGHCIVIVASFQQLGCNRKEMRVQEKENLM